MADDYTTRLKLIKPESGSSLNTWGTKLNANNFDLIDVAVAGASLLTITGDTTLTLTNGDATSTQLPFLHRYGGAPSAAFGVTYVAQQFVKLAHNASGQTATPKVSTGFSLPNGAISFIAYNATYGDVTNVTPNYVGTGYTVSQNGHIANKAYVDTAVAAAAIPGANGTIKVDAAATAGYAFTVLLAGTGISISDDGDTMTWSVRAFGLAAGANISGAVAVAVNTAYLADFTSTSYTITLPAAPTAGDRIAITKYGTNTMTLGLNSLKFKGSTTNPTTSNEGITILQYTGASRGWVEL